MTDKSNVTTIIKTLKERAAKDGQLLKAIDQIDELLLGCDDTLCEASQNGGRSNLPYSSDPPVFEAAWK